MSDRQIPPPPPPPPGMVPPPPPPPVGFAPPPPPPPPGGALSAPSAPLPASVAASVASVAVPSAPAAGPTRTIRKMDAICVDVVRRTHDSATLYLFVGDTGPYKAGQFVSIDPHQFPELKRWLDFLEFQKGKKEPIRSYSMSSIPGEKCVSITVKAEEYDAKLHKYPPLLSPLLASGALKGRECVISGFTGGYTIADDIADKSDQIVHFVAGSGIVPNYAILKDELRKPERKKIKHTMINVNKTIGDIILHEQLVALAKAYPNQFELINLVTREDPTHLGAGYFKGRPTTDFVKKYIKDPKTARFYACGAAITKHQKEEAKAKGTEPTPRFMESVEHILHELEVPKNHLKKEEFG